MDFPYLLSSLKYKLDISHASGTGMKVKHALCGVCVCSSCPPRLLFPHLTTPGSISAPGTSAHCRDIIPITATKSILIWTIHCPPCTPRRSSAAAAQVRWSFEGTRKVTSSFQQISCWFCVKKTTASPQKSSSSQVGLPASTSFLQLDLTLLRNWMNFLLDQL